MALIILWTHAHKSHNMNINVYGDILLENTCIHEKWLHEFNYVDITLRVLDIRRHIDSIALNKLYNYPSFHLRC